VISPAKADWFGFVLGHVSSVELVNHTDAMSTGTKMPRTKWQDISAFQVALPPKDIAAAFTEFVDPIAQQITANIHQSRILATLRDTLLPKLFSGSITLANGQIT
jgi:type I restriction enzyme S subunit